MRISKRVGKMALELVRKPKMPGGYPCAESMDVYKVEQNMGSGLWDGDAHFDTLMCLIASIAGVNQRSEP